MNKHKMRIENELGDTYFNDNNKLVELKTTRLKSAPSESKLENGITKNSN